jgi:hypothetical protein
MLLKHYEFHPSLADPNTLLCGTNESLIELCRIGVINFLPHGCRSLSNNECLAIDVYSEDETPDGYCIIISSDNYTAIRIARHRSDQIYYYRTVYMTAAVELKKLVKDHNQNEFWLHIYVIPRINIEKVSSADKE